MTFHPHIRRPTLRTLALAAAAFSGLAQASPDNVPFKASVSTQEVLSFDPARCPGTFLVGRSTGKGKASHMGAISIAASDCPATLDGVHFFFSNGILTMTAANGDTLTARYEGSLLPIAGSGLHRLSGTYAVTGGTGRFAGARGSGNLQGTQDLSTSPSQGQFDVSGLLSY